MKKLDHVSDASNFNNFSTPPLPHIDHLFFLFCFFTFIAELLYVLSDITGSVYVMQGLLKILSGY